MPFISQEQIIDVKSKLTNDISFLGKLYRAKKNKYQTKSVDHSLVDEKLKEGWLVERELKTKTNIYKEKSHFKEFEDDIWCQFYELGYRFLNIDETLHLPWGKGPGESKQIDIIAIDDETVFLVECKSSEKLQKKAPSYKDEFDVLNLRLEGLRKTIVQLVGKKVKIKYVFATRNIKLASDSLDIKRLEATQSFYYNDDIYDYVERLISNYKDAARFQFFGLIFKNQTISDDKIEVSALKGEMGGKEYYMFSIEPSRLLKMSYILHRTRSNTSEFPTYQRLLKPLRLPQIKKFLDEENGYFPNSIIVNFSDPKQKKLIFEPSKKSKDSSSKHGLLKISNEYAIAYIIDGQHRLYGYAGSRYVETDTIPVVAFLNLEPQEQLKIFMDINQTQKAVSKSLIIALNKDMLWHAPLASDRLKALRSSIVTELADGSGPLAGLVLIGEEKKRGDHSISGDFIVRSLGKPGLLPTARGNKYNPDSSKTALYNIHNQNHEGEMLKTQKKIVKLINNCYEFLEKSFLDLFNRNEYFFTSSRGSYAFIYFIGNLNSHLTEKGELTINSTNSERFLKMKDYLEILCAGVIKTSEEEQNKLLSLQGPAAHTPWVMFFQLIINKVFSDYEPRDFLDWKERQDESLQDEGRKYGESIERFMKKTVISNLQLLYGDVWDMNIATIKRECVNRASLEDQSNFNAGIKYENADWKEMFNINDYKTIIGKHWTKSPEGDSEFLTFEKIFSIDVGMGFNSKTEKVKWISEFNKYRNLWAHAGTKEKRLNKKEVDFLLKIYKDFKLDKP